MKLCYKVSHFVPEIPRPGFWGQLSYICEVTENMKKHYFIVGRDLKKIFSKKEIDNSVKKGILSKLPKSYPISKEQGVFLKPNGDVILALDDNPVKDKKAIVIGTINNK